MGTGEDFRHHIASTTILEEGNWRSRREKLSKALLASKSAKQLRFELRSPHNSAKLDQLLWKAEPDARTTYRVDALLRRHKSSQ